MNKPVLFCLIGSSILSGILLSGCLKDHCTHSSQYKLYTPVYTSLQQIRSSVKSEAPRSLENTGKIFYHNGYLFVNELNKGVHVIDDHEPSAPKNAGFINIPGNIDITARGNILYADSYTDMVALDISSPLAVKITSREKEVFASRVYGYGFSDDQEGKGIITDFKVKDTVVENDCDINWNYPGIYYDAAGDFALASMSSKSSQPTVSPTAASVGGSMSRFTTYGDYLYTVQQSSLGVYHIASPAAPDSTTTVNLHQTVETIFPYNHYLFIGSPTGMLIYDVANPRQPANQKSFSHYYSCDPVVAQDGYAYVTLRTGATCGQSRLNELDVVDVKDMNNLQLEGRLQLSNPHGLSVDGHKLIVCDGEAGIRFIDVTDPAKPEIITTISNVEAYDAIAIQGLLIVTTKQGIYQYDYSNFKNPKLLSKISTNLKN